MTVRLVAVTVDVPDARVVAAFWASLLVREVVDHDGGLLLPGDDTQVGLRFITTPTPWVGPDLLHLHVTTPDDTDQQAIVERALAIGARHVDVGQQTGEDHVVLADPGGQAFCVIEPGNSYLAGTGTLGEVACDGTRDVGLFWSGALGWPLVWDQDEETAIQSPHGGTKVAWGGPPVEASPGWGRQRFELVTAPDDLDAETDRLVALGAGHMSTIPGGVILRDPDGNHFTLTSNTSGGAPHTP